MAILDNTHATNHPLNILISTTMGSGSHAAPQLSMVDVLAARGHRVMFASYNDKLSSWSRPHPLIYPLSMGENPMHTSELQVFSSIPAF
jgi:hypothetical protein